MADLSNAPHLAVPFRIVGGRAATVEDGTLDEVTQNVRVILGTRPGERLVVPEFGLGDPTFGQAGRTPSTADLVEAVAVWEPRATLRVEYQEPSGTGDADVEVSVSMRGT